MCSNSCATSSTTEQRIAGRHGDDRGAQLAVHPGHRRARSRAARRRKDGPATTVTSRPGCRASAGHLPPERRRAPAHVHDHRAEDRRDPQAARPAPRSVRPAPSRRRAGPAAVHLRPRRHWSTRARKRGRGSRRFLVPARHRPASDRRAPPDARKRAVCRFRTGANRRLSDRGGPRLRQAGAEGEVFALDDARYGSVGTDGRSDRATRSKQTTIRAALG